MNKNFGTEAAHNGKIKGGGGYCRYENFIDSHYTGTFLQKEIIVKEINQTQNHEKQHYL